MLLLCDNLFTFSSDVLFVILLCDIQCCTDNALSVFVIGNESTFLQ
jgi:hypothetical protein